MTKRPDAAIFSSAFLRNTTLERYQPCEPSKQNFGIPLCAVDEVSSMPRYKYIIRTIKSDTLQ